MADQAIALAEESTENAVCSSIRRRGVISCREAPPINARYRRAIRISGLSDATVCLFSERGRECAVSVAENTDFTPIYDTRFVKMRDDVCGEYLRGEHISGNIYFLIGREIKNGEEK